MNISKLDVILCFCYIICNTELTYCRVEKKSKEDQKEQKIKHPSLSL